MVNGKNRNHSSIAVFPDMFQGISCTFQYILQYEFRAEQPPIPVYNSNSERDTHLCNSAIGGVGLVPAAQSACQYNKAAFTQFLLWLTSGSWFFLSLINNSKPKKRDYQGQKNA